MTTSDWRKAFKQLRAKPTKLKKYAKHNTPKERPTGFTVKKCRNCGRYGGHISTFGLGLCRHCFREQAQSIGFKKYS